MERHSDVLIVGGGAVGACCALELARAGADVVLIERGAQLASACSAGSAGLICPGHSAPISSLESLKLGIRNLLKPDGAFFLRPDPTLAPWLARYVVACRPERARRGTKIMRELSVASLELHASLADEGLPTTFTRRGILNAAETDAGLASLEAEAGENAEAGLRVESLDGDAARSLEPELGPSVVGAVFYPDEAHCDGARFVEAVGASAHTEGASLLLGVEGLRLLQSGSRVLGVETNRGRMLADTIVIAAGAWTQELAGQVGVYAPVVGGKGYHVELAAQPSTPAIPVLFKEARVAITPLSDRVRVGGTLELSGLNDTISQRRVDAVLAGARRGMPGLTGREPGAPWLGLRPCSPDGVPIIGATSRIPNVVVASGHAHMGLALAPITGRLVREIIRNDAPSHDLHPLRPERFQTLIRAGGRGAAESR